MTSASASQVTRRRSIGKDFRSVWLSVVVSSTGDGMFLTAFPLLAVLLTREPVLIAGVTISTRLPWLLFSMFTGAIADRMDRRKLMIAADLLRVFIVGALVTAIITDFVNIWQLYICAFLLGACETLHVNAAQGIIPAIVQPDDLLAANARFASGQIVSAQFIGPPIGVALFSISTSLPFVVDAVSFAGSAAMIATVPDKHGIDKPTSRFRDDIMEGLRFTISNKPLRRLTEILAFINFFYFAAQALLVLYNVDILGGSKITFTALSVGAASGTVISRFFVERFSTRFGVKNTMLISMWMWALATVGLAATSSAIVAIGTNFVLGFGTGLWITLNTTLRQRLTPARLLGRMNAVSRTISWGIVPFGAAFGGVTARIFGLRAPFILSAISMVLCAMFGARLLRSIDEAVAALDTEGWRA